MYEKEFKFLQDNIKYIEAEDWDYLRDAAINNVSWDNILHIFEDPDVNIDISNLKPRIKQELSKLDPTSDKKYYDWLKNLFLAGAIFNNYKSFENLATGEIIEGPDVWNIAEWTLKMYEGCLHYGLDVDTDINNYNSLNELRVDVFAADEKILEVSLRRQIYNVIKISSPPTKISLLITRIIEDIKNAAFDNYEFEFWDTNEHVQPNSDMYKWIYNDIKQGMNVLGFDFSKNSALCHNLTMAVLKAIGEWYDGKLTDDFAAGKL